MAGSFFYIDGGIGMKKQFKRALATLTALMIIFTMIPGYMVNAASSLSNEIRVYNYLVDKMGLNTAAACGLLANVKAESNFEPKYSLSSAIRRSLFSE